MESHGKNNKTESTQEITQTTLSQRTWRTWAATLNTVHNIFITSHNVIITRTFLHCIVTGFPQLHFHFSIKWLHP